MNFFTNELRPILVRAPWMTVEPLGMHMKLACHITHGVGIAVSNMSASSWVGSLTTDQLVRGVSVKAPGIHLTSTELLRMIEDCARQGSVSFMIAQVDSAATITFHTCVEVLADHKLPVLITIDLLHVSTIQLSKGGELTCATDFLRELVIVPSTLMNIQLHQLVSLLIAQHRITPHEVAMVAASLEPPSSSQINLLTEKCEWFESIRAACCPLPTVAPTTVPDRAAPANSDCSPLQRRESVYVESPEEVARRRKREEERILHAVAPTSATTVVRGGDDEKMKKIRKVLR